MRRSMIVALAGSAAALLLASGCTSSADLGTTPGPGGTTTGKPKPTPAAASAYPADAKSYVQKMVDNLYSGPDTVLGLVDSDATNALTRTRFPDDHDWHFYSCGDFSVAQARCAYDNDEGDRLVVTLPTALLGKAHAIHAVVVNGTRYDIDATAMGQAFFDAWLSGNTYRMKALTTTGFTEAWLKKYPASPASITASANPTHSTSTYTDVTGSDGDRFYDVAVTVSQLGHPHAITALPA